MINLLKVWLPLDGDLRNLGASDIEVTNHGATVNDAGKIGKCYYFNGSAQYLQLSKTLGNIYSGDFSWCVWLKPTDNTRSIIFSEYSASGSSGVSFELLANRVIRVYWNGSPDWNFGISIDKDEWSHVAITKKNNTIKVYVNGQYRTEKTGTLSARPSTACIRLGDDYRGGTNVSYMGYMNDARIYDHCLSAAEVKEIAQGLILHYKLDDMKIKTGANLVTGVTKGGHTTVLTDGRIGVQTTGENADTYFTVNLSESITNGTKYFLSCDASGISEGAYWSFPLGAQGNSTLPFKIYNGHNEYSFTANDINWGSNRLFMDDANRADWANKATFWNFELYKTPTLEVEDSSGYGHNGEIIGDLIPSSDTKRYSTSTRWNCSSPTDNSETGICYIQTPFTLTTPLQLTVAWWAKPESGYNGVTNSAFCTSNNASRPTDYNRTAFHHRDSGFDIYPSDGSGVKRLSFTYVKNEWHHYAITYDGTTAKSYKDGALQTSVAVGANKTLTTFSQLYIGYSQAGGVKRKTLGNYSDFRIYCTPLLDTDIKLLYNIGMRVDNSQGIHSFEFDEIQENLFRSELISPYAKSNFTTRIGEIVYHNDAYAMNIAPAPFYKNLQDNLGGFLLDCFEANTSYTLDMWIDVDSVIHNGNNVSGGLQIVYSDGTSDNTFVLVGGNKGYQHKKLITPANKTIKRISVYYYVSTDVFYRLDSYICKTDTNNISKTGITTGSNFIQSSKASIAKGGEYYATHFIEI